jgi:hypothetical protein
MTRAEKRKLKQELKKEIAEFFNIQQHYFPELIQDIKNVLDCRHESYTTYEIEVIIYVMILKNVCSITTMKEMTDAFNEDKLIKNIYKILKLDDKKYLPHYVTINECLSKLDPKELEKIRKNMLVSILRKRSFQDARLLDKYWCVIVDATQLYSYKNRHCNHCLTKTFNKGEPNEKTVYYHQVLEAKIILGDCLTLSIGTEFIDNEYENISKQDCEVNAFKRLSKSLKKMFPRLPICILGDSLYANEPFMKICEENSWEYLIRYKEGSIPSLASEYETIVKMNEAEEKIVYVEEVKKGRVLGTHRHHITWVNDLEYKGRQVSVMVLDIDKKEGKNQSFQWLSSMAIKRQTAVEFTQTGRQRWLIENEGFNNQKNKRYMITHQNSKDYQALQNHYLITQIADMLVQLYEYGMKGIRELKRTIENVSKGLLESLRREILTEEDLIYKRRRIERNIE